MMSPSEFQRKFLGRNLWSKQQELCRAIATNRSVSVKGCHGSGKTYTVAGMVPYEMIVQDESIVLTIAPTLRQVKLMWNEIETAIQSMPIRVPDRTTTGWQVSDKCHAIGFSSSKGVNAQGFHGKRVLIIADEAIGISPDLWDAIEGIRAAGDVRLVKLCNPTVPSGAPYEDFTRLRGSTTCITISAFDTPNLQGLTIESLLQLNEESLDYAPYPWLTRRRWVKEMYYKWGPTNPRFMSRVLGEFPTQSDDSVFSLALIERAGLPYEREELRPYIDYGQYVQIGIDVAGPGNDETVATARLGPYILDMEAWADADPREKCEMFLSRIQQRCPRSELILVGDTVGIGYYFMRQFADKFRVICFVANAEPIDPILYWDAKAEAYFHLREYLKENHVHGVEDETCKAQLSDIRYRERAGRIEIESKREAKARGGSSPDRAESLIMAYAKLRPREQHVPLGQPGGYQISPI